MNDLKSILHSIGLEEKEISVYLALLELHEAIPAVIAKRSGVNRITCYRMLDQLIEKCLVSHFKRKGKMCYRATNPHTLFEEQQKKVQALEKVMPDLMSLHDRYAVFPQMSVYDGVEGMNKVMDDTLKSKTEILCWTNMGHLIETPEIIEEIKNFNSKKISLKLFSRCIMTYCPLALEYKRKQESEYREIYLVSQDQFPFTNEINIYDDKMVIVSSSDKIAVVIENRNIANTFRSIFELSCLQAKALEPSILTAADRKYLLKK